MSVRQWKAMASEGVNAYLASASVIMCRQRKTRKTNNAIEQRLFTFGSDSNIVNNFSMKSVEQRTFNR